MALVKFESEVGNLLLLHNYAVEILEMIGHSGAIPSALLPERIDDALQKLENNLEKKEQVIVYETNVDFKPPLTSRIFPFRQLLLRANEAKCEVSWNYED